MSTEDSLHHWAPLHAASDTEGSEIFGLPARPVQSLVHLVPVPFDATTSFRPGTAQAPAAIRKVSDQVDLTDGDCGRPYRAGIHMLPIPRALEQLNRRTRQRVLRSTGLRASARSRARDRVAIDAAGARVNTWVREQVTRLLDAGRIVGILGGDHSIPFGAIEVLAERHSGLGILQIDAHADLRAAYQGFTWSHASIMHNVMTRIPQVQRLVQVGIRDYCDEEIAFIRAARGRIVTCFDTDLRDRSHRGQPFARTAAEIVTTLPREVWVSFDVDGLEPSLCPQTGTPVPGGLDFHHVTALLTTLVRSGRRIVGFDLCEVAPAQWDATVGARLLYKLIGLTLLTRISALGVD